jgi:hypothetical protein
MDEYLINVLMGGKKETLKSFGDSIYSIIDNMIMLHGVEDVFLVTRIKDQQIWDVDNMDIEYLRGLRKDLAANEISEALHGIPEVRH